MNAPIDLITSLAVKAAISEVAATVKPGLVDRRGNGSHKDMCFYTFVRSTAALVPHFKNFAVIGAEFDRPGEAMFEALREEGLRAEESMFAATGGVNTHKGLIFAFAIILGSAGSLTERYGRFEPARFREYSALLAKDLTEKDLKSGDSSGLSLYVSMGARGARGEAESGYSSVFDYSLPVFETLADGELSEEQIHLQALMSLYKNVTDTNVLARGGRRAAEFVRLSAADFLGHGGVFRDDYIARLSEMDDHFIEQNISPGGCADLLAATILLFDLNKLH